MVPYEPLSGKTINSTPERAAACASCAVLASPSPRSGATSAWTTATTHDFLMPPLLPATGLSSIVS